MFFHIFLQIRQPPEQRAGGIAGAGLVSVPGAGYVCAATCVCGGRVLLMPYLRAARASLMRATAMRMFSSLVA